ncbi:P-loop containing nucleoside triphosphate hydrolase protein [Canariomyces notabilis]|uniref:P-loop containing nucleoside triphosphate hydrolase protein n=1 Tax=Canariomyces notabilis TaxID=2074819 RepID=A0AAN6TI19_9PEZI|nr:P-loop containing nucleoside triphosphate hydrolase protein [Canariomyces arenarius]
MDLHNLIRGALPTLVTNTTNSSSNGSSAEHGLPHGILESLTPLLGAAQFNPLVKLFVVLNSIVGSRFGLDPALLLSAIGLIWALNKLCRQLYSAFQGLVSKYLTAHIQISSTDDIYLHMMKWLASQPSMVNSRSLTAETVSKGAWDEDEELELLAKRQASDTSSSYLNFSNQEAKAAPRFTPALGMHNFWFRGRYFGLHRKQESLFEETYASGMPSFKDKETIILTCFGRSPDPIKQLLQHAKEQYYIGHQAKTTIKRPAAQAMRRYGNRHTWQQVAVRPVRPMRTVVLDEQQKNMILSDVNEYLHPATPRWYANRGIPLRRGYLFHGPPGTGKTSLSFALAGVFGLDIYVISLLDPSLTEEDLSALFITLPRRCVVLLEDIDSAGLTRPSGSDASDVGRKTANGQDGTGKETGTAGHTSKEDWKVSDLARELKKQSGSDEKKAISLSGLLNAIDGVASHEGRVLIMTTNRPETLDEALIRPGRVDLQVAFTNATQDQARELFMRMYEPDSNLTDPGEDGPRSPCQLPPLTPFSEPPPTPFSPSSFTDISSSMGVEAEAENEPPSNTAPSAASSLAAVASSNSNNKPAPLNLNSHSHSSTAKLDPPNSSTSSIDNGAIVTSSEETIDQLQPGELARIASAFAAKIPSGQFSPAELQGFLLKRKKTPRRALAEVDAWVEALQQQKANKTKVLQVQ